jgi:hypothetical protein
VNSAPGRAAERNARLVQRRFRTPFGIGHIPAQLPGTEVDLLIAGTKPAAILSNREEANRAAEAGMLVGKDGVDDHDDGWGEEWFAARDDISLRRLREALAYGDALDLGLALGYSKADVYAFHLNLLDNVEARLAGAARNAA